MSLGTRLSTYHSKQKNAKEEESNEGGKMGLQRYDAGTQAAVAMLLLFLAAASGVSGQTPDPSCASNLIPCAGYLNSTTPPPDTCCEPLRQTVKADVKCLCNLYSSPDVFKSFGVNISDALQLPKLCGIKESVEECYKKGRTSASAESGNSTSAPPSSPTPPSSAGAKSPPGDASAAGRGVAWIGSSSLLTSHVLWAAVAL